MWKPKSEQAVKQWKVGQASGKTQLELLLNEHRAANYLPHFITEDNDTFTVVFWPIGGF